ncbi:MAG: amidohydrolase [Clostridia bacterium]|nr:amidohydrolase [Clostridia bacterium]
MDTILFNGKVYVEKGHYVEAVKVDGNLISKIGSNEEVLALKDANTRLIDCKGKTLIPGLNDSHMHCTQFGEVKAKAPIDKARSVDELVAICQDFLKKNPDKCKNGLHAIGWNQDLYPDKRMPNRYDLDKISTDIPVIVERVCGHVLSGNSKVVELMGLEDYQGSLESGEIYKDENGVPNGIVSEYLCNLANELIPKPSLDEQRKILVETMDYLVSHGLTSVQSNDVGTTFFDADKAFALLHDIYDKGEGKVRYRHQVCFNDIEEFKKYLSEGEYAKGDYPEDGLLQLGPLKLFKDGSLGARTALMKNGYADDPDNHGTLWLSDEDMDAYCILAAQNGLQVVTHCIGDLAVEKTMDSYEKAFVNGKNELRHALVHCQVTDEEIIQRIIDKDILVFAQPIFLDYDMKIVEELCGKDLADTSYAFGTLIKRGAHLAYGTDAPVEDCNPFPNIYMAVTRCDISGYPEGGFNPKEKVDVETAIDAYTLGSAYGEFMEDKLGRIKEGYLADMILLDRDIFTVDPMEIKDILPVLTMVNGSLMFEKEGAYEICM